MRRVFLVLLLLVMGAGPAAAENVSQTVKAGRTTTLYTFGWYGRDNCRAMAFPQPKVRQKPQHGSVKFFKGTGRIGAKGGKCAGRPLPFLGIHYTPARGYRGKDRFSVTYSRFVYTNTQHQTVSSINFDPNVK